MGDTKIIGKLTNAHSCLNLPGRGGGWGTTLSKGSLVFKLFTV